MLGAHLPRAPKGRTFVAAAGKAAASMALAAERNWSGKLEGIAVTRYQHGLPTRQIEVVEAGHPVPDEAGEKAARRMLEQAKKLGPDDLLLALLSGGGSSLLAFPIEGLTMAELKSLTGGRGTFSASLDRYDEMPSHLAEKVVADHKKDTADSASH